MSERVDKVVKCVEKLERYYYCGSVKVVENSLGGYHVDPKGNCEGRINADRETMRDLRAVLNQMNLED